MRFPRRAPQPATTALSDAIAPRRRGPGRAGSIGGEGRPTPSISVTAILLVVSIVLLGAAVALPAGGGQASVPTDALKPVDESAAGVREADGSSDVGAADPNWPATGEASNAARPKAATSSAASVAGDDLARADRAAAAERPRPQGRSGKRVHQRRAAPRRAKRRASTQRRRRTPPAGRSSSAPARSAPPARSAAPAPAPAPAPAAPMHPTGGSSSTSTSAAREFGGGL